MPSLSLVEKPLSGFSASILQSVARIICLPMADKFHTYSLRSIFRQVHALAENVFGSCFLLTQKTLRGFWTV